MNHNAATLPNNLPPNVDDKPLARQKRKRTSPEDQAVLEAYYARDPKPDKAARVELVQHVALGEKEVQVGRMQLHHLMMQVTNQSRSGFKTDDRAQDESLGLYCHTKLLSTKCRSRRELLSCLA